MTGIKDDQILFKGDLVQAPPGLVSTLVLQDTLVYILHILKSFV